MAETSGIPNLAAIWRQLNEANLRYYAGYAKLVREYYDEVIRSFQATRRVGTDVPLGVVSPGFDYRVRSPAPAPQPPVAPALALGGPLGAVPTSAFVVENALPHPVRAPLVASPFRSPSGAERRIDLAFEPGEVDLESGEQVLVRVTLSIDEGLEPGVTYRGSVAVPGLPGTHIPLVVRRDPDS